MIFKQIKVGEMDNFCYVVGDNGEAAVVDPGWEYKKILEVCRENNLKVKKILLTHGHFDHVNDLNKIVKECDAEVFMHQDEEFKSDLIVSYLKDGDKIKIGTVEVEVIHTPGHTPGSVCYLVNNEKIITGDTLFVGTIGRTDLAGGDFDELKKSLKILAKLEKNIEVFPGHDYGESESSTIGRELASNPYMGL